MIWALWAALAMVGQDLLMTWLVQAEAAGRAHMAGVLDSLGWPMGMITTFVTVTAMQGHDGDLKAAVIGAVSIANYVGTSIAVRIGRRHIRERESACVCGCPVPAVKP
jgi:hypothetical protein